jgi:purine-binding chemotaxis protein CheW
MSELATATRTAGLGASGKASIVCFELRGQRLGCPIAQVKETLVVRPITRVFLTPTWVSGIINLRGDIVAVLDLGAFLGLGATVLESETRIVITRSAERVAGLLVDRLAEVRAVDLERLEPPPATLAPEIAGLLAGVATLPGGAPLAVLDLGKLFDSDRLRELARRT